MYHLIIFLIPRDNGPEKNPASIFPKLDDIGVAGRFIPPFVTCSEAEFGSSES